MIYGTTAADLEQRRRLVVAGAAAPSVLDTYVADGVYYQWSPTAVNFVVVSNPSPPPVERFSAEQAAILPGGGIVGASKIRKLTAAIAQSAYTRKYIAIHGHSIPAGAYCDNIGTLDAAYSAKARTQSFSALLAKGLATPFGGSGLCAAEPMCGISSTPGNLMNPIFTLGGTAAFAQGSIAGPSYGSWITLSQTGRTMSFTAVGTSFKVWALSNNTNARARWSAPSVSAGAIQTIAAAVLPVTPNTSTTLYWNEYVVTGVTPGETVTLYTPVLPSDPTSAIPYYIDLDYRPNEAGISVYRICSSGQPLVFMHAAALDNTDTQGPSAWVGSTSAIQAQRLTHAQSMSTRMDLSGVILQSDVNDLNTWSTATGLNFGYTLDDHKRHLDNYLRYHYSLGLPVLVLLGPIRDPAFAPGDRPYNQADLIAAMKTVIEASPGAAYFDLTAEFGGATPAGYAAQSAAGMTEDIVHWGRFGHGYNGNRITQALLAAARA